MYDHARTTGNDNKKTKTKIIILSGVKRQQVCFFKDKPNQNILKIKKIKNRASTMHALATLGR